MTMRRQALGSAEPLVSPLFLFVALLLLSSIPSLYAKAETAQPARAAVVSPGDMNTGALLLNSEKEGGLVEAPRLNTDVVIHVDGTVARTVVTQRFENPNDSWVEGIYVFPLPEQSAVDALRMEVGSRVIDGEIKGRKEAKELYEDAKDAGQVASLVEQERPNIFTNSVANIGPHESVVIRIEYQETVKQDGGVYSLRFPLVVGPRYNPAPSEVNVVDFGGKQGSNDPVPDRDRITPPVLDPAKHGKINPVSISVKLNAGFVLGDIKSSFHQVNLTRPGEDLASLTLAEGTVPADKDFELTWSPKAASTPQIALFHEIVGGQDYLLAMVTPPTLDSNPHALPRELIFVIDNSGSMAGTSIVEAKKSLLFALDRLRAGDKFNVIRFDDTMERVFPAPVDASSEKLAIAKHFVSSLDANGGTEMLPALRAALNDANPNDTSRVRQIVFLTDGAVGNEAQLFSAISSSLGRSRLFTVGIGSAPNSYFMTQAAELGRGTFTHIGSEAQVLDRMKTLFSKLEKPVMVGLKAEWPAGMTVETWPNPLPDLYAGEPVVLSSKVGSMNGELHLSGMFEGKPWGAALRLSDAVEGTGVAKLWARSKIDSLEAKLFSNMDAAGVEKQIETVALEHHLVSSQTSLVAIDPMKTRPDGSSVTTSNMPTNLPDGWEYDKVFGPNGGGRTMQKAMHPGSLNNALGALPLPRYRMDPGVAAAAPDVDAYEAAPPPVPVPDPTAMPKEIKPLVVAPTEVAPPVNTDQVPTVVPANPGKGEAQQPAFPVLPLTVNPKSDASPLSLPPATLDMNQRIVIFLLALVFLSAVTLGLSRYHRRDFASPRRIGRRI